MVPRAIKSVVMFFVLKIFIWIPPSQAPVPVIPLTKPIWFAIRTATAAITITVMVVLLILAPWFECCSPAKKKAPWQWDSNSLPGRLWKKKLSLPLP